MRRLLLSGLMVLAFSVTAFAGVDVSKLQLPGDITQAQADTVIKGALAKAKEQGVPMNIAVVDAGGNLTVTLGDLSTTIWRSLPRSSTAWRATIRGRRSRRARTGRQGCRSR